MTTFNYCESDDGKVRLEVGLRGSAVIHHPLLNKGTAFTTEERKVFGLEGLLPTQHNSMALQVRRTYASLKQKVDPLEKYIGLAALQDRNEHLYYRVLCDHLDEFMPIVYTPTVGLATRRFSHVFRRGRGVWITPEFKGRIADVLSTAADFSGIRLLVVTDNESILGIGDQGAGGMAISVGKLALYCAAAGIHPIKTLPVSLDVGTNNPALLDDDLYLGWRNPRLTGRDYEELVEEFVEAVDKVFPGALVQWEDLRKDNALRILERYRDRILSFNDDIQGTGAVALAAVLSAERITGIPLEEQRIVIFGAGAAGLGIARQLRAALAERNVPASETCKAIAVLDSRGLLTGDRGLHDEYKRELAWPEDLARAYKLLEDRDLETVVKRYRPTVLIGSSGQAGAFSEKIVRSMTNHVERPVVLPFSNPTDHAEASPQSVIRWTKGQALVATGSPFEDVEYGGRTIKIGQGNNVFIFPGLGMGALIARATRVSDGMISAASRALAEEVTENELASGSLFPAVSRLRHVSKKVATAVVRQAREEGIGRDLPDEAIGPTVDAAVWEPEYPELVAI